MHKFEQMGGSTIDDCERFQMLQVLQILQMSDRQERFVHLHIIHAFAHLNFINAPMSKLVHPITHSRKFPIMMWNCAKQTHQPK